MIQLLHNATSWSSTDNDSTSLGPTEMLLGIHWGLVTTVRILLHFLGALVVLKKMTANWSKKFLQHATMLRVVLATTFLSIRQSHASIVSKRMNVGWCRLHWRVAQVLVT